MARFAVTDGKETFSLIGKKMSNKWMAENYGTDWKKSYENVWHIKKHTKGIHWVFDMKDEFGFHKLVADHYRYSMRVYLCS